MIFGAFHLRLGFHQDGRRSPAMQTYVAGGGDPKQWRILYRRNWRQARKHAAEIKLLRLDKITCS